MNKYITSVLSPAEQSNGAGRGGPIGCIYDYVFLILCIQGIEKTAKSNFGGGNTNWEERKLGTYAFR